MQLIPLLSVINSIRNGVNIKQRKTCIAGIPITRIETISNNKFNWDKFGYADIFDDRYENFYLEDGDVLFSHINSKKFVGRSVLVQIQGQKVIHGMNLLRIKFKKGIFSPKFFIYYSRTQYFKNSIDKIIKNAVNQSSVSIGDVKNIKIPFCSLEEQNHIVAELDNIEEGIRVKTTQLKALDELIQSCFAQMFGDIYTNEFKWDIKKIEEIATCIAGATPNTSKEEYWEGGTIPWLSSGEVHKGRIFDTDKKITELGYNNCSTKLIPAHTVVLALAGQGKTRGTVGVAEIRLCTNQSICSIVTNKAVNTDYLYYYLKSQYEELRNASNGAGGRGGLNLQIVGHFKILLPPLPLQNQFAQFVQQVEKAKEIVKIQIKDLQELLALKMDEYFK